ncbi:hypothetical protein MACH17_14130 [Phaeobacter inhibens]|nr:hypothetical protein MACH17_14130 [Phaeobacter inhibens]
MSGSCILGPFVWQDAPAPIIGNFGASPHWFCNLVQRKGDFNRYASMFGVTLPVAEPDHKGANDSKDTKW